MTFEKFKVPVSMLAAMIDPGQLGFDDTGELEPLTEIIDRNERWKPSNQDASLFMP